MKLLVTGFDAFGGETINPAQLVVEALPDQVEDHLIHKLIIPTTRYESFKRIKEFIDHENPDVVLSIGQAGGNSDIAIERIGINCDDYRMPDNGGNQPIDEKIVERGRDAYFATIPVRKIVENIRNEMIPARISNSAGTFVCNHVLYSIRQYIEENHLPIKSGFIHIPFIPNQVINKPNTASMDLETIHKAILIAIKTIIESQ